MHTPAVHGLQLLERITSGCVLVSNFVLERFLKVMFAPEFVRGSRETNRDEGERKGNWGAIGKCLLAVWEIGRVISISQQWLALPICWLDGLLLLWLQCSLFNVALEISSFVLLNLSLTVLRTGAAFYPRTKPKRACKRVRESCTRAAEQRVKQTHQLWKDSHLTTQ